MSASAIVNSKALAANTNSCRCGGAFGSWRLVSSPIRVAPGAISRANSICLAGNPAT